MIHFQSVTKTFGEQRAVDALELKVGPGEVCCLLGANGAGKSTSIQMALGFLKPNDGQVLIDGHDVQRESKAARKCVAYIPEALQLYSELSGIENLRYFSALNAKAPAKAELERQLSAAGLPASAHHKRLQTYSKGMRQKVGIALAYAKGASTLLLDEPTSGLDPSASDEFAQALVALRDQGSAVLMATHDLFRARASATHIAVMSYGKLVEYFPANTKTLEELESLYLKYARPRASVGG